MKTFTELNLSLEAKARKKVIEMLRRWEFEVIDCSIPKEFSLKDLKDLAPYFDRVMGFKLDLLASKNKIGYWVEVKGKSKEKFKGIVNVKHYDFYYKKFIQKKFPFVYFIWVEENDKIYSHDVVDPKNFEKRTYRGRECYIIPDELIRDIQPSHDKRLDAFIILSEDFLMRMMPKTISKIAILL